MQHVVVCVCGPLAVVGRTTRKLTVVVDDHSVIAGPVAPASVPVGWHNQVPVCNPRHGGRQMERKGLRRYVNTSLTPRVVTALDGAGVVRQAVRMAGNEVVVVVCTVLKMFVKVLPVAEPHTTGMTTAIPGHRRRGR